VGGSKSAEARALKGFGAKFAFVKDVLLSRVETKSDGMRNFLFL
jgi:hypothetical protein